jgi:hypothetical protein
MFKPVARFVFACALIGVPLVLPAQTAYATTSVVFNGGGSGVLLCGSQPSRSQISVPEETTVRFSNALKSDAQLTLNGTPTATVPRGESVEVVFHRGPVTVAMVPDCSHNLSDAKTLTVLVTEPEPAQSASPHKPGGKSTPGPVKSGQAAPPGSQSSSTPGGTVPGGDVGAPATVVDGDGNAQALIGNGGRRDNGSIGLLAIMATVCVVGVSAGAMRAIITRRAGRPGLA